MSEAMKSEPTQEFRFLLFKRFLKANRTVAAKRNTKKKRSPTTTHIKENLVHIHTRDKKITGQIAHFFKSCAMYEK